MTIPATPTFFETLQGNIAKTGSDLGLAIATESSPLLSEPLLRMSVPEYTAVPSSLALVLDSAYLFHLLARDPQKVVAPGKSLLSVLAGLNQAVAHTLESPSEKYVRRTMHQAFWDQALEALSSPLPSSQISRLKGLYQDLHEALAPLFPPQHPALVAFSLPLPPTPSPLLSAITHIRDALLASRQRCAPVRDTTIDGILHQIDHRSRSASTEELAELLVNSIRSVLELSIDMRNDYSNAVLARASEQELTDMVTAMAETQERRLVLQLWGSKDAMREAWTRWMESFHPENPALLDVPPKRFWILRLIESLGKPYAVTSKLFGLSRSRHDRGDHDPDSSPAGFPEPKNELPPQFLFSGPAIFRLQNHIQALTIAASLKSLVPTARPTASSPRPPLSRASDTSPPAAWTFTERIWALLEPEIGEDDNGPSETKIVNLADEVVMAYRNALSPGMTTLDAHAEQNLRSSVDRILRTDDPVFVLLQKRLLAALSASLLDVSTVEEHSSTVMEGSWPRRQRGVPSSLMQNTQREIRVAAKGFEDPVIAKQCSIAASALRSSVEWVERVWGDSMPY